LCQCKRSFKNYSINPSPKAEPFKQWLAQVGSDLLDEIENPELATQRTRELYKLIDAWGGFDS
jgi:hypothetical protein